MPNQIRPDDHNASDWFRDKIFCKWDWYYFHLRGAAVLLKIGKSKLIGHIPIQIDRDFSAMDF